MLPDRLCTPPATAVLFLLSTIPAAVDAADIDLRALVPPPPNPALVESPLESLKPESSNRYLDSSARNSARERSVSCARRWETAVRLSFVGPG
ncbi:hypothetical protein BCR44DRAFT_35917 [Catenaria anguillulae PL171]|uniref:Secreted protein n=1 Tax=Catenaria anguillulae PL171 TaxID=765915 RepID=A0A1Y2HGJ0_9FUNG|nr:hypothetical protein BCR44DRAFT_35917 [Catenaria anguillulae PL171]